MLGTSGQSKTRSPPGDQLVELLLGKLAVVGSNRELGFDLVKQVHR